MSATSFLRLDDGNDARLDERVTTLRVRVPCGCKRDARSLSIQVLVSAADMIRHMTPAMPPEMVVLSHYCQDCKWIVKVTARHLHFG